jgi:hypothetical protein
MFCKNARTKIAMATLDEPKPAPLLNNNVESQMSQMAQPQQAQNQLDPARMFLMQQQLDPSIQMFIQQQLTLCTTQDQLTAKQQQLGMQQQQSAMAGLGTENGLSGSFNRSLNLGNVASSPSTAMSLSLQQHIQAQKEQQNRFLQLQQIMAHNLQRQKQNQNRSSKSNNFRASAA